MKYLFVDIIRYSVISITALPMNHLGACTESGCVLIFLNTLTAAFELWDILAPSLVPFETHTRNSSKPPAPNHANHKLKQLIPVFEWITNRQLCLLVSFANLSVVICHEVCSESYN